MSSTQHYHFTLFESTDKPTWLTDWNTTISAIDTALYNIASGGGDLPDLTEVVARLQALEGRVDSDELRLNQAEGYISDMQDTIAQIQVAISDLESADTLMAADIGVIREDLATLTTNLSAVSGSVSALNTRVTALEESSGGGGILKNHINTGQTNAGTTETTVYERNGEGILEICVESISGAGFRIYFDEHQQGVYAGLLINSSNNYLAGSAWANIFIKQPRIENTSYPERWRGSSVFAVPYTSNIKVRFFNANTAQVAMNYIFNDKYAE